MAPMLGRGVRVEMVFAVQAGAQMGAADGCGADGGLVGAVAYPGAAARGYKYAGCAVVCSDQVGGLCPAGDVFGFCLPPYRKYFCGCAAAFSPQLSGWLFETANDSRAFGWLGGSIGIYRELQRVLLAASVDGLSETEKIGCIVLDCRKEYIMKPYTDFDLDLYDSQGDDCSGKNFIS